MKSAKVCAPVACSASRRSIRAGADAAALHVRGDGDAADVQRPVLEPRAGGADDARADGGLQSDGLGELVLELRERLRQRRDARVLVDLALADVRRTLQGEQLAGVAGLDRRDHDLGGGCLVGQEAAAGDQVADGVEIGRERLARPREGHELAHRVEDAPRAGADRARAGAMSQLDGLRRDDELDGNDAPGELD